MKRFSKILAFVLTACILFGLIVTAAFANTEPAYTHPTLTNASATNVVSHNFETDNVGAYAAHNRIGTSRITGSALKIKEQTVNGVSNKFFTFTLPNEEVASTYFLESTYGANQRSSYIQFKPNSDYQPKPANGTPQWYQGVYDADLTDSITPVTNNFDYMTFDFDFSAQGARVDYADGTFGRAVEVVENADGSYVITLDDGTVVVTNAAKTETTMTKGDAVTVWTTNGNTVTETATASDGSKVVSVTVVAADGSAVKTITTYGTDGTESGKTTLSRSAVVDGGYTVTYDTGKTMAYVYAKDTTSGTVITETYTITDGSDVTVYTFIDSTDSARTQILTYQKTVNGVVESENVSTFLYKNTGGSHTNKAYIPTFNAEFKALGEEFSQADIVGKHIVNTRTGYAPISMYNTWRWYDATNTYKTSTNNFYSIGYLNGSWGIFREGKNEEQYRLVTLPDEIGVWNHISIVVEANNEKYTDSLVHFVYNGELLDTYKLSEVKVSSYAWVGIEDWRMTVSDILPKGDENFFSLGFDNLSINTYKPTVTYGEDGNVTERIAYSSGEAVGIDDFCKGGISLANCADTVYSANYMIPNENYYAIVGGNKYVIPSLAVAAIKENAKNGETVETTIDLLNVELPEGVRYINIKCAEDVECTAGANLVIEKTADGYTVKRQYVYADDFVYYSGNNNSGGSNGAAVNAPTFSTLGSVTHGDNKYTRYAYKADSEKRYRYDFAIGAYNKSDFTAGYQAREYSYFTVDLDLFADKYVYVDGEGNQVLTDTIPEGVTEYKLAYADGTNISLDLRTIASATATSYGSNFPHPVFFRYIDGDWHVIANSKDTGRVLSRNLYEVNHFTFAVKVNIVDGNVAAETRLYLDGELIATNKVSTYDFTIRAIDWYNADTDGAEINSQKYSMGLDNLVANYYSVGYTSGDMAGVDDLFKDEATVSTVDYDGIVYNAEYPLDPSVNGYVQVAGGEKIYNPVLAKRVIEEAPSGSAITATRAFYNVTPGGDFVLTSPNNSPFTITKEALESFIYIPEITDGVAVYTVRLPGEDDKLNLIWVDTEGNILAKEELVYNNVPDDTDKNGSIVDLDALTAATVNGWYWDLDGEGSAYSETAIGKIDIKDISRVGGNNVIVYPKTTVHDLSDDIYVAYFEANGAYRLADKTVANFADAKNIQTSVAAAPDGSVIKFIFASESIVLPISAYYGYSGKAITFDLNGKTVTRYNTETYGSALIRIGEGASCTVTSSVPGARVFLASKRGSTVEGNGNNRIFGAGGLVQTNINVDSAYVEISNLEFNGGTFFKADGGMSEKIVPEYSNDVSINVSVKDVVVYAPNRSSYAAFATLAPDVVINIEDSKFYVPDGTYSLFHDYEDTKNNKGVWTYYVSETDLTMSGCEVLCYTEGESAKFAKLWYNMGKDSSMYVENSKIIAELYKTNRGGKFTWGPGCEISTNTKTSAFKAEDVVSGVQYTVNNSKTDAKLTLSFTRADFTTDWSNIDATNGKYIDSVYTNTVDITRSAVITFITYKDPTDTQFMSKVDWKDQYGDVIKSSYELVGSTATPPVTIESLGLTNIVYKWFSKVYSWGGEDGTLVVKFGDNVFSPIYNEATHINGKQANMSLTTGMIFNLYIPTPDEFVKAGSVYSPDSIAPVETAVVNGVEMLKLSFVSDLDDFAATTATICFTSVDGEDLTYEVDIDALRYVTLLADKYECNTDEAQLAYEIVAYKKAVATYIAEAEGKTLDTYLTEAENTAIAAFEAVFTAHADGCTCTDGLYDAASAGSATMNTTAYTKVGITGFAYLLNSDNNGLRINVTEGATIKYVSYEDLSGTEIIHDEALENLKLIETETERYYVVYGVSASDTTATFTVTMSNGSTVTYSLAQYINSTGANVAKALYSYAKAAAAYKTITADEQ